MIKVLGHSSCTYCKQATMLLALKGKSYMYLDAKEESNKDVVQELLDAGITEVPQIWVEGERIGGYRELMKLLN